MLPIVIASVSEVINRVEHSETFDCFGQRPRNDTIVPLVIASGAKQSTAYECPIRSIATLAQLAHNDNGIVTILNVSFGGVILIAHNKMSATKVAPPKNLLVKYLAFGKYSIN